MSNKLQTVEGTLLVIRILNKFDADMKVISANVKIIVSSKNVVQTIVVEKAKYPKRRAAGTIKAQII